MHEKKIGSTVLTVSADQTPMVTTLDFGMTDNQARKFAISTPSNKNQPPPTEILYEFLCISTHLTKTNGAFY
jgi:hypothetical protein